jgi:hypothetical protein
MDSASESTIAAEELRRDVREFARSWVSGRQGSAAEFLRALEKQVGWPARHVVVDLLNDLRFHQRLPTEEQNYLHYTLGHAAVVNALAEGVDPTSEHQSSLDELFARSREMRKSAGFAEAIEFISKFRAYSPFNNMLVYLQNPRATYFATASHWQKTFGRNVKPEARGMLILAPKTPVLVVYDIADTDGSELPDHLQLFKKNESPFDPRLLATTLKNCERDKIQVERQPLGQLHGGFATTRLREQKYKMRIVLRSDLDDATAYSVLCHELAHVYLGHLGSDRDGWWPYRTKLSVGTVEIEAEAAAHIVCRRIGLQTRSAEYLANYVGNEDDLELISLDLISRVAARIEEMGRGLLAPRKKGAE